MRTTLQFLPGADRDDAPAGVRSFTADPIAIANYGPLETDSGGVVEIEALRPAKNLFVARLAGVTDRNAAERLTNAKLFVPRERLPQTDDPDEFYHADLVGLAAVDQSGNVFGTVIAIFNFGAGDLIVEIRSATAGVSWKRLQRYACPPRHVHL